MVEFVYIYKKKKTIEMNKKMNALYKRLKKKAKAPINPLKKNEYIEKQAKKMSKKMTWPEREFVKLMKELKIKCEPQKIVGAKIYDFYLTDFNILVEVDGDYWHGNEVAYDDKNSMQKRAEKNDLYKDVMAKGLGYKIERVWESDLKKTYKEVKERFRQLLKS